MVRTVSNMEILPPEKVAPTPEYVLAIREKEIAKQRTIFIGVFWLWVVSFLLFVRARKNGLGEN